MLRDESALLQLLLSRSRQAVRSPSIEYDSIESSFV